MDLKQLPAGGPWAERKPPEETRFLALLKARQTHTKQTCKKYFPANNKRFILRHRNGASFAILYIYRPIGGFVCM